MEISQAQFEQEWLASLNDKQREAAECLEGPLLVLAGAGTGKTRVLTVRLMTLVVKRRAYPSQLLAATFTNKAAREIIGRVQALLGEEASRMALGTFHALSVRLLRRYAETIGMRRDFTIVDTDDQKRLLKEVLQEMSLESDPAAVRRWVWLIQRWKDRALLPDAVPDEEAEDCAEGRARQIYRLYQQRLFSAGACDFGDLILHCVELFRNNSAVLNECRERFRYLLIDEYQDTNVAQYLWMRLLAEGHKNICCVGDDDQSIYGWRGAEVGNILRFEKDFPQAKVIRLERNYRSQPHILQAAAGLISRNRQRLEKTLWTQESDPDSAQKKIAVRSFYDGRSEAQELAEEIESLHCRQATSYGQIAVLVRVGTQMRAFEEAFIALAVPYRVVGGKRFYEREEIRDVVAYLRATRQSADNLAFRRIANKPTRGLGAVTMQKLIAFAQEQGLPEQVALEALLEQGLVKGRAAQALALLQRQLQEWRAKINEMPLRALAERIVAQSGYAQHWRGKADEQTRLDNITELFAALEEVEDLEGFLEQVALVAEGEGEGLEERISLMTMHAAKGLEFDAVFLPGWEEGLFPMQRSLQESGEQALEEERRLAYVALTRARKHVTIGYAQARHIFGHMRPASPSRFIKEIPREALALDAFVQDFETDEQDWHAQPFSSSRFPSQSQHAASATAFPDRATSVRTSTSLKVGDPCKHRQLGKGRVVGFEKNTLTVAFPSKGVYRIDPDYVFAVD